MHEPASVLSAWESFYVIVGSSGGALIGLQFVFITLIADRHHLATRDSVNAFGTPTVVHFTCALAISAIMSAPWSSLVPLSVALLICGLGGMGYSVVVILRARRQTTYEPVWEDWLWYVALPCIVYVTLAVTSLFVRLHTAMPLFVVGAAALALLLIGIHNAWDTVIHIVVSATSGAEPKRE